MIVKGPTFRDEKKHFLIIFLMGARRSFRSLSGTRISQCFRKKIKLVNFAFCCCTFENIQRPIFFLLHERSVKRNIFPNCFAVSSPPYFLIVSNSDFEYFCFASEKGRKRHFFVFVCLVSHFLLSGFLPPFPQPVTCLPWKCNRAQSWAPCLVERRAPHRPVRTIGCDGLFHARASEIRQQCRGTA